MLKNTKVSVNQVLGETYHFYGVVKEISAANNGIVTIQLNMFQSTHPNQGLFEINLNNQFEYERLLTSISRYIERDIIDLSFLINKEILLVYMDTCRNDRCYCNFHRLVILEELINEGEEVNHE
ncbi:hypothetical protein [Enterococcus hirae]|uniref:hypothetical protein n=1 Tax=Enterococcus hirae TaxID=1354 RepID=UPI00221EAA86|nr:hypothetical protein [Enterococcus hirae]UYT96226.1 hypothetical protein OKL54_04850 [Enterococcus hirae]UYT97024.1 hypothetical protein OKL53_08375 [Enterococcus hirae]UYU01279.1 hypothetical protein OKL58_04850 [Enterococcus hirae]